MGRRRPVTVVLAALVPLLLMSMPGATSASAADPRTPAQAAGHRSALPKLTVVTYNIHHAVGIDQQLDLERIARVIEVQHPDVGQLSEVDKYFCDRSGYLDQPGRSSDAGTGSPSIPTTRRAGSTTC